MVFLLISLCSVRTSRRGSLPLGAASSLYYLPLLRPSGALRLPDEGGLAQRPEARDFETRDARSGEVDSQVEFEVELATLTPAASPSRAAGPAGVGMVQEHRPAAWDSIARRSDTSWC